MTSSAPDASTTCAVCGAPLSGQRSFLVATPGVRPLPPPETAVAAEPGVVCERCYRNARITQLESRLMIERGELSALEIEVARKAAEHLLVTADSEREFERSATRGQRLADRVARVGGSWTFVLGFGLFILVWTSVNSYVFGRGSFDPYPYILLNLLLSCTAAFQAPIIMMSQNRSGARDRARAELDYQVNLKAELEVGALHEKLDHLLHERWESLAEIQHEQLELLRELLDRPRAS